MKRIVKKIILTLVIIICVQLTAAFVIPYYRSGAQFCRVQPRLKLFEMTGYETRNISVIKIVERFDKIVLSYFVDDNDGKDISDYRTRQIHFGYTDGKELFGWSYTRFSYYKLTESTLVSGNPGVIHECAQVLKKFEDDLNFWKQSNIRPHTPDHAP